MDEALLQKIKIMSGDGCGIDTIIEVLGLGITHDHFMDEPELTEAYTTGMRMCIESVEKSLIRKATGYTYTKIKKARKRGGGWQETPIEVYVQADTNAIVFFLCNRRPEEWKNIQRIEVSQNNELTKYKDVISGLLGKIRARTTESASDATLVTESGGETENGIEYHTEQKQKIVKVKRPVGRPRKHTDPTKKEYHARYRQRKIAPPPRIDTGGL